MFVVSTGFAQETYPTKPITIIVPQAAGGANDTIARAFGQRLAIALGSIDFEIIHGRSCLTVGRQREAKLG